eukprot:CAMPEP_0114580062 /NCGR_PEP_ID=MMETSP0125-20121206/4394_1 /TAXON_ID=485358 ORGANISM="Aristerostoma sp., Strain ATCC 50986" /NCGR_SAMPLE_ID=MMETSP0125 /ASSEMBLY_ACC=CAM_ASM_000245 /LENGTH=39 /DNA_ID= /DNA_START= /DNA_END= /DNA_ORIENTATION=
MTKDSLAELNAVLDGCVKKWGADSSKVKEYNKMIKGILA